MIAPFPESLRRHLVYREALRARGILVPEDRSPQRMRADLAAAEAEANAATWLVPEGALDLSGLDDDEVPSLGTVYEGQRLGQDALSREISRGAMHTCPEGSPSPSTCGECFLTANDPAHLAHRAS